MHVRTEAVLPTWSSKAWEAIYAPLSSAYVLKDEGSGVCYMYRGMEGESHTADGLLEALDTPLSYHITACEACFPAGRASYTASH